MKDRLDGNVFMIRLCDLCDLRVKFLLRQDPAAWMEDRRAGDVFMIPIGDLAISV
jgi:hypothetical protein